MAKIKFSLTDVNPDDSVRVRQGNFETPPIGVYQAKIADAQAEEPEDKDPRLHLIVELQTPKPPKDKQWPQLHEYIAFTDRSKWKLDQFLQAMGLASKTKRTGEFDDTKLKNKPLSVLITHETDTWNDQTRTRARIANFLPKGTKSVPGYGAAATNGDGGATADQGDEYLDKLGSAADGEDEDAQAKLTDLAEEVGLDPEEYDTWAELATAISEAETGEEEEAEEEEAGEEEEAEEEEDLDALGVSADEEDEDAQARLADLAEEAGLDPDEYDTWAELATALQGEEEEGEEEQDYESMKLLDLKKLAKERGISSTGTREEIVERLQEYDSTDPFED